MNKDQFLPYDVKNALGEYKAAKSCVYRIEECLTNGDLVEAKLTLNDLSKSIRELEKLQEKKRRNDEFETVVHQLSARGILEKLEAIS
ncbi:MAG: hypothetical protein ACQEXB_18605 [Bacillota bacterium]